MQLPQASPFYMSLLLLVLFSTLTSGYEYIGSLENLVEHHSMSVVLNGVLKYDNILHGNPPKMFCLIDAPESFTIVFILTENYAESNTYFTRIIGHSAAANNTEQTSICSLDSCIHQWKVEKHEKGFTVRYDSAPTQTHNSGVPILSTWFPAFIILNPEGVEEDRNKEFHKRRAANYNGLIVSSWDADTTFKLVTEKYVIRSLRYGEMALFNIETALRSDSWNVRFDVTRVNVSAPWMFWPFQLDEHMNGYLHDVSQNVMKILLPRGVGHYLVYTPGLDSTTRETYDGRLYNDLQNYTLHFARQRVGYGEHIDFVQKEYISEGIMKFTLIPMADGKIKWKKEFSTRTISNIQVQKVPPGNVYQYKVFRRNKKYFDVDRKMVPWS